MGAEEPGPAGHNRGGHRRDATHGPSGSPQSLRGLYTAMNLRSEVRQIRAFARTRTRVGSGSASDARACTPRGTTKYEIQTHLREQPGSPDGPPTPKTLNESDLRVDGARRHTSPRQGAADLQPLMRDPIATVSRERAVSANATSVSVASARMTARLLSTPQRRRRYPRAQPPDSRARLERCPLVADRRWTATASGAATVIQPSERRRRPRSRSAP